MSSLTKPSGPLPENTYWRRRAVVIAVALLVVVGLGRLFTGGDAQDATPAAAQDSASLVSELGEAVPSAAQDAADSTPSAEGSDSTNTAKQNDTANDKQNDKQNDKAATEPEATDEPTQAPATVEPQGECLASDVTLEPRVADQPAGRDIKVRLLAQTDDATACLWKASKQTLTVKITSGSDNIWYSSECAKAVPNESVVLRNDKPTRVRMTWDARRSDEGCTVERDWALPGTYHLEAAALGGEPQSARFVLETPTAETVEPTPKANAKKSDNKKNSTKKNSTKKNNADSKKSNNKKSNNKKSRNKKSNG